MGRKLLSTVAAILFAGYASAQQNNNSIEVSGLVGTKIFSAEGNKLSGNFGGVEVGYMINMTQSNAAYARYFDVESIDVVASYRDMNQIILNGDPTTRGVFGGAYAIMGRMDFRLLTLGKTKLLLTPGVGLLYSTQSYFTDHRNLLIGSHINVAAQLGVSVLTPLSPTISLQAGIATSHYSNGGASLPNSGINSYLLSLGLVKKINTPGPSNVQADNDYSKNAIEVGADIGYRGLFEVKHGNYKSAFYLGYNYRLSPIISLKIATDAVYYYTKYDPNRFLETYQYYGTSYDKWSTGISLGTDIWFGKLAFTASYGHYLHYRTYFPNNQSYWNTGFKYYLTPWMALQAKVYVHHTQADFIGYGVLFNIH